MWRLLATRRETDGFNSFLSQKSYRSYWNSIFDVDFGDFRRSKTLGDLIVLFWRFTQYAAVLTVSLQRLLTFTMGLRAAFCHEPNTATLSAASVADQVRKKSSNFEFEFHTCRRPSTNSQPMKMLKISKSKMSNKVILLKSLLPLHQAEVLYAQ